MKTRLLLFILFECMILLAHSQDKGYIVLSLGSGFPTGDFGSNNINNEAAGFATTGTIVDLSLAQKFGNNFGMTLLARIQVNGVDTDPLLEELSAEYPGIPWTAEEHNWATEAFMGGFYGSFPLGNGKFNFETRALIGLVRSVSPEFTFSAFTNNHYYEATTLSATADAFGYLFGVGFKLGIGKHLGVLLNVDYLGANPEFEDVMSYTRIDAIYNTSSNTFQQSFGSLNVGVGIGWRW